jgi:hypothetical protein
MLLQARPLYDNRADQAYFVASPEWPALMRAVRRGVNVLVIGDRGVGKTTMLRQAQLTLREDGWPIAFVDASVVGDVLEFAARIRDALLGQPAPLVAGASMLGAAFSRETAPLAGASRALAATIREIGNAPATTILVDASGSAKATYALFGRMRDTLWQQPHNWIVALDESDRATALKPPADAFFNVVLTIAEWSQSDLLEMLTRREDDDEPLDRGLAFAAAGGSGGNPREVLRIVSDVLVHGRDPQAVFDARQRLLERANDLGRPAGTLMAELLERGQASPSDDALQASLGVSRARLTQLLRSLLEHHLVITATERADGPGRPRTVYRPALPT